MILCRRPIEGHSDFHRDGRDGSCAALSKAEYRKILVSTVPAVPLGMSLDFPQSKALGRFNSDRSAYSINRTTDAYEARFAWTAEGW